MLQKDMLGSLVRVLVASPDQRGFGLMIDIARKLAGADGETWNEQLKLFTRKLPTWATIPQVQIPTSPTTCIIRVDRSLTPECAVIALESELEANGPAEYTLANIECKSLSSGRYLAGYKLYELVRESGLLPKCLSIHDGEELMRVPTKLFRVHFGYNRVWLWKSATGTYPHNVVVPYIEIHEGVIIFRLGHLGSEMLRSTFSPDQCMIPFFAHPA